MGAAAGKQFQSEKAKHAQAVLSAVEVFEESNREPNESYGGVSTEFFKKKVMLAASDAKRKGKDIEKSLAQLTDADLDMLAHYVENRKDEERRLAASNGANAMKVEEIVDDADNAGDNIDETTSVLSYGDDEEGEGADNEENEMDSSGELIENIEEVVERPRLNSGFKVFPMDGNEEAKKGSNDSSPGSNQKSKLKLDVEMPRQGIADHFAKFWDYEELGSLASQATHGPGTESPTLSPTSTVIGKKFQPSPKQSFPYKDRGQRIDERNETLMVLQRQKVISLTQNAQLEREVEALQRQLEKMDQLDQTFESSRGLGNTNKSVTNSLNNTAGSINSSHTVGNGSQKYYGHNDLTNSVGYGSGNLQAKYSYIYPIDEEAGSQSIDHSSSKDDAHVQLRRGGDAKPTVYGAASGSNHNSPGVITGVGLSLAANRRNRRDRAAKGGSSPSSSDNDSTNSYSKNASSNSNNKYRGANPAGAGGLMGGSAAAAQSKGGIVRVKSNDPSDLSDGEAPSAPTQPVLAKVGKAHSSFLPVGGGAGSNANAGAGTASRLPRRGGRGILSNNEADSDDGAQHLSTHSRLGGAAQGGYNPSHPSNHPSLRNASKMSAHAADSDLQAKQASVLSDGENQHDTNGARSGKNSSNAATKAAPSKRVVGTVSKGAVHEESDSKRRDSDNDISIAVPGQVHGSSPKVTRARRLTADDSKQVSSPARPTVAAELGDKKYQALLDNVSMHLEAVGKEHKDNGVGAGGAVGAAAGGGGSNKLGVGRNTKGGALKKLNKRYFVCLLAFVTLYCGLPSHYEYCIRYIFCYFLFIYFDMHVHRRHSMDGLDDTDTSQDEVDANSPSGNKFKKFVGGRNNGAGGQDKSPPPTHINANGAPRLAPTEEPSGHFTTDDESVGPGAQGSQAQKQGRRPRAKLQVHTSSPQGASAVGPSAALALDEPSGYQPSSHAVHHTSSDKVIATERGVVGAKPVGNASDAAALLQPAAVPVGAAGADGETAAVSTKVKRRVRAVVAKPKGEAAEGGAPSATSAPAAASVNAGPWDTELDQW